MTANPTATWRVLERPIARDGDSVYLVRERELYRDEPENEIHIRRDIRRVLHRTLWLAAPEISGPNKDPINGPRATRDAQEWFDSQWEMEGTLVAVQYGFEKYGRPLVDVQSPGGGSFSQYMLKMGWPPYLEG